MVYVILEKFRDPQLAKKVTEKIHEYAKYIEEQLLFMHICGSHEWSMTHYGIRSLLPENVEVRAGPGCPVCITPASDIDTLVELALEGKVILSYGDMSRAKGSKGLSVMDTRSLGSDVRLVYSVHDAIIKAKREPERDFIFFGAGFDTTAPPTAYEILNGIPENLSFMISYRYMPPIAGAVLRSSLLGIDGVINPGHSSTITGMKPYYRYFLETRKPQVFCGFEPLDLLLGILMLLKQIREDKPKLENEYTRSVTWSGNITAQKTLDKVFELDEGYLRGVATLPECGFRFKDKYKSLDVYERYSLKKKSPKDEFVCGARCGEVILGLTDPPECPLYMKECTPSTPKGPTMVSQEGTCKIWAEHGITNSICRI
ncbi:MAG: hydrogenase formation protein HypD [Candidatus Nitrosocaldaceae archaeon]|nr:MAG: hydrogenase formation protein HypD [Candidatus Nitrosocaldaceae archaeon]GIU72761.1 MAG: hydrogenase formation protein HypD [Candidatus Nitrosocaldaceae archaeon]GIU72839.1 MAG: hydrogenase formation protein HypD [Candidatus Nitrosocaldaceae archaeon]